MKMNLLPKFRKWSITSSVWHSSGGVWKGKESYDLFQLNQLKIQPKLVTLRKERWLFSLF